MLPFFTLIGLGLVSCSSNASETPMSILGEPFARLLPTRTQLLVPRAELNSSLSLSKDLAHLTRTSQLPDGTWQVSRDTQVIATGLQAVLDQTPVISPDGKRVAWGEKTPNGWRVVLDGQPSPPFTVLGKAGILASSDSQHFAWQGRDESGWHTVVDGVAGPAWRDIGPPILSPQGGHIAYAASGPDGPVLVRDGISTPVAGAPVSAAFSAKGEHFAMVLRTDAGLMLQQDEVLSGPYSDLGPPVFAATGNRQAQPRQVDGRWEVFLDGSVAGVHDQIGQPGPVFCPTGEHVAWWASEDNDHRVHRDGQPGRIWTAIGDLALTWSADGQHLAWIATTAGEPQDGRWHVIVDDIPFVPREPVASLALSPDGAFVAWVGRTAGGWAIRLGRTRDGEMFSTTVVEGVGTDWGGGIAFADGLLRYTAIDSLGLSLHEAELPL